jgi:uncharacterized protein (DUF2147 family)
MRLIGVARTIVAIAFIAAVGARIASAADAEAAGNWKNPENGSVISVYPCDADLCAKIASTTKPDMKDDKNPDTGKKGQPLVGLVIMDHAKKSGDSAWSGNLYNPDDGKTYSGSVTVLASDQLQLKGCALVIFCKSLVFTKVAQQ